MQLDELVLYGPDGATRSIALQAGRLNIITGDSRTGKSSLINIIRFLLGGGSPHAPRGPIQDTVLWYGMRAHVGGTSFFIARPAPEGDTTTEAMLVVGDGPTPPLEDLAATTTSTAIRGYLGGLIGIDDNLNLPAPGQTRRALSASFVHSLHYCFQGQGEIANPDILFHRQNHEWMPQTIRDTLPFFLGAQDSDDLRLREKLTQRRRELRQLQQRIKAAESERTEGLGRAAGLLNEAIDVGLLTAIADVPDAARARDVLRQTISSPVPQEPFEVGGEFERLRQRRAAINDASRELTDQLNALEAFAAADRGYGHELAEQNARLASIELVPVEIADASCAMCGHPLDDHPSSHVTINRALERSGRRLESATRDRPLVQKAREELLARRISLREEARELDRSLDALADQDELIAGAVESVNVQSYVRGRIAQYLDSTEDVGDLELEKLRGELEIVSSEVDELSRALDADAIRSRTTSLLRTVSRRMTSWARELNLSHANEGVQIDIDRLTIVADTPSGPAYMDRGEIGSALNWVGYHLTAYLALQSFFIEQRRPVPRFLVLDQPSQAFFPRDRDLGGDLEELTDTDREHTRQLYNLTHDVVSGLAGRLQVIALDHADFDDPWFAASVVERWRGGKALIPEHWYEPDA